MYLRRTSNRADLSFRPWTHTTRLVEKKTHKTLMMQQYQTMMSPAPLQRTYIILISYKNGVYLFYYFFFLNQQTECRLVLFHSRNTRGSENFDKCSSHVRVLLLLLFFFNNSLQIVSRFSCRLVCHHHRVNK